MHSHVCARVHVCVRISVCIHIEDLPMQAPVEAGSSCLVSSSIFFSFKAGSFIEYGWSSSVRYPGSQPRVLQCLSLTVLTYSWSQSSLEFTWVLVLT